MKHNQLARKHAKKAAVLQTRRRGDREVTVRNDNNFYTVEVKDGARVRWLITFTHRSKALAAAKEYLEED
jgi:hypothetical protein